MRNKPCGHPPGWDRLNGCLDCRLDRIVQRSVERVASDVTAALAKRFPALQHQEEGDA